MNMIREIIRAIRFTLILWIITAVIYPVVMIIFGQVVLPFQANGSLIKDADGIIIGSALIGQPFRSDKYFYGRPSTSNYSTADPKNDQNQVLKTGVSSASNLAPSNPQLLNRIQEDISKLQQVNIPPTADLVYTSGSGLDPHISIESAKAQIRRIARARSLDTNQVEILINQHTDGRFLGIFGEPGVNVLQLNLALDKQQK